MNEKEQINQEEQGNQGKQQKKKAEVTKKKLKEDLREEQWHPLRLVTYRHSFPYNPAEEEKYRP